MKKRIFAIIFMIFAVVFSIASMSVTSAWYVNVTNIGRIDAETKDLTFAYRFNGNEENELEYNVKNLTFFDITSSREIKYFLKMCTVVTLEISNNSNENVNYWINYYSNKTVLKENDDIVSISYAASFILPNRLESVDEYNSINNLISASNSSSSSYSILFEDQCLANDVKTLYLYLFGVQEIASANNSFLIDSTGKAIEYGFNITIHSEAAYSAPDVNEVN